MVLGALLLCGTFSSEVRAHYHGLIPLRPSLPVREEAEVLLFFGHPFEHQLFELEPPERLQVISPSGEAADYGSRLLRAKEKDGEGKLVERCRIRFSPGERGDWLVALAARPRLLGPDEGAVQDFAKVVVHVQAERGWDRTVGSLLEVAPLSRPYGLRPGAVFLARALLEGRPAEGAAVEVERYNPAPPSALPEDPFITRTARSGPGGLVGSTLDEPGWWAITVSVPRGAVTLEGKERALTLRATLWVYVGEPLEKR
jgi:cobalt/nickel transport protein